MSYNGPTYTKRLQAWGVLVLLSRTFRPQIVETENPAIVFNDSLTSNETPFCEPTVSYLNNNKIDFRISFEESDDEDYTIWYDEDVLDLRSVETEFPAIVFNDSLTSNETPSCEPTVSYLNNNEIDFRISFDESDDEDYTVVFDKHSFSYKEISTNDLKTDSENDNKKVNNPLFPSPEPSVSCIDDLDFFKDFENEIPAIVYNDALTSKSDFSTEPTLCPQHIDNFVMLVKDDNLRFVPICVDQCEQLAFCTLVYPDSLLVIHECDPDDQN
ncbi:hypothetical protein Tco_0189839 [Tanacetum coccineum]